MQSEWTMACLDTNFLLDLYGRGGSTRRSAAADKLRALVAADEGVFITCFTVAELYVGVYRSRHPFKERELIKTITDEFPMLEFTADAMNRYGAVVAARQRVGRPMESLDALIASIAIAANQTLVTHNVQHFRDVPGLTIDTY